MPSLIARRFGDRVQRFATFNEPSVFTLFGYGFAWHPPGLTDPAALHQAIHHVNLAHGAAVDALRAQRAAARRSAPSTTCSRAAPSVARRTTRRPAALLDEYWNLAFPEPQILGHYPPALARAIEPYRAARRHGADLPAGRLVRPQSLLAGLCQGRCQRAARLRLGRCAGRRAEDRRSAGRSIPAAFRDTLIDARSALSPADLRPRERRRRRREAGRARATSIDLERIGYLAHLRRRPARGRRRRRRRARLLRVVPARQLRMGRGLRQSLRTGLCRLSDAAANPEGLGALVRQPDPDDRAPLGEGRSDTWERSRPPDLSVPARKRSPHVRRRRKLEHYCWCHRFARS